MLGECDKEAHSPAVRRKKPVLGVTSIHSFSGATRSIVKEYPQALMAKHPQVKLNMFLQPP